MITEIHAYHLNKLLEDNPSVIYKELYKLNKNNPQLARNVLNYNGDITNYYSPFILSLCYVVGTIKRHNYFGSNIHVFNQTEGIKILELMTSIGFDPYMKDKNNKNIYNFIDEESSPLYQIRTNNGGFIGALKEKLHLNYDQQNQENEVNDATLLKLKHNFQKLDMV
jgi:hypothetical protein